MASKKIEATAEKQRESLTWTDTAWFIGIILLTVLVGFGIGKKVYSSTTMETRVTCLEEGHDWEFQGLGRIECLRDVDDTIRVWEFKCSRCGKYECLGLGGMTDAFWRIAERQTGLERPQPYNRITTIYRFK